MVAVPPLSAFEMYHRVKSSKKKKKSRNKNDKIKVNDMLASELRKAKSAQDEIQKSNASASSPGSLQENSVDKVKTKSQKREISQENSSGDHDMLTFRLVEGSKLKNKKEQLNQKVVETGHLKADKRKKKLKKNTEKDLKRSSVGSLSPKPSGNDLSAESSIQTAERIFAWMMDPISKEEFLNHYWEKRPVHISRKNHRDYYESILSTGAIDQMLRHNNIVYGENIDITSYSNGIKELLNSTGRAHAPVVWDSYRNGCSVRLLNPQTYHPKLRELNTRLQEVFGSFVGANAYLTPPNSQGFAPHYDDIEAFVLQIEGSKMWRIYAPLDPSEKLPRNSSPNFSQDEIGEPILEVCVEAGDLLYFPRGFIHQASTVPGEHSLHVTVSTYQKNAWADLLETLVPAALSAAIEEDVEFRRGMPLNVMEHLGVVHSESESPQRAAIMMKLKKLFSKLFDYAPVDAAADQVAKGYIHEFLPPILSSAERKCSVLENSERMTTPGKLQGAVVLAPGSRIRLTRSNVLRLVSEEESDNLKIYHSMENSLVYQEREVQCIEIPIKFGVAVEHLIHAYPDFTSVSELPLDEDSDKMAIATELWERGLVLTEKPLLNTL